MIVQREIFYRELSYRVFGIDHIRMADKAYWFCKESDIVPLLYDSYINRYEYTLDLFDCDDFALVLHAFVRQEQYKQKWKAPMAFGEIWLPSRSHAINFVRVVGPDRYLLIEPQNDNISEWSVNEKANYVRC